MLVILATWFVAPLEAQISKKGWWSTAVSRKTLYQGKDIKDLSDNKNDGLIKGKQNTVKGKVGDGMEFAGAAPDYIAVRKPYYAKGNIEKITLVAWVKVPSRGMIASWDCSEFFRFGAGDDPLATWQSRLCCLCWHGKTKVTNDKWYHVAVSFDGKNKRIYIDGKLDAEV